MALHAARAVAPRVRLVRITLVRSPHHARGPVLATLTALGFRKLQQSVIHVNIAPIRGKINAVKRYVVAEDVDLAQYGIHIDPELPAKRLIERLPPAEEPKPTSPKKKKKKTSAKKKQKHYY